jgi:hypothetical protein
MAFKKIYWGHTIAIGGKRVIIGLDGKISPKELDKLTIPDLWLLIRTYCSGRIRDDMIAIIMRGTEEPSGFWATLTPEQQEKALAYRGAENHGAE